MARDDRPAEQPAVRTTIVGGRPPGSGKPVGPIPRGIEVLIKKAAVDPEFRAVLLEKRAAAADEIGLALDPAEALMLRAAPRGQLETIIARTKVQPGLRSAFLGRAAAVMLVALGAGTLGCEPDSEQAIKGIEPDRPSPTQPAESAPAEAATTLGIRPEQVETVPPAASPPVVAPREVEPTDGVRPDRPPTAGRGGSRPDQPTPPTPPTPPPPTPPPGPPAPTGIRPDRPPTPPTPPPVTGIQPDRPPEAGPKPEPPGADAPPPASVKALSAPRSQATALSAAVTRGVQPDRPPTSTGIQPDKPAPKPAGDTAPAAPAATATEPDKPQPIVSKVVALPPKWDEAAVYDALAKGLKRLAEQRLEGHKLIYSSADAQRYVRIEWKARQYDVPATDPKTGATVVRPKTGPEPDGLLVTAWLETRLTEADRPQVRDNAGLWKTQTGQVFLVPLKTYLKFNVHYGPKTEADLVTVFSAPQGWIEEARTSPLPQAHVPPAEKKSAAEPAPGGGVTTYGISPDRP